MSNERTEKTDKQANKLVEKRTKLKKRKEKISSKKKKTRLGKKIQEVRLNINKRKTKKVQEKINKNPTAKQWRRDGEQKEQAKPRKRSIMGPIRTAKSGGKYRKGGFKQESFLEAPIPRLFED